jgi:predicted solute-binding protein
MALALGVPNALYVAPLLYGLEPEANLIRDLPAQLALKFPRRTPPFDQGCAFLSPLDYARHGGDYLIVPDVAVCSSSPTATIQLAVKSTVSNITTVAVDVRVTSEIILTQIILQEKYPNIRRQSKLTFIPMWPDLDSMLKKADAALIVNFHPTAHRTQFPFMLDLVEEWQDLTDLPYVHGFWVGPEAQTTEQDVQRLIRARHDGEAHLETIAEVAASSNQWPRQRIHDYFAAFSYGFGDDVRDSVSEFIHYAYYSGILPDVPELNFFESKNLPDKKI